MKTFNNSNSVKAILIIVVAFTFSVFTSAQFQTPSPDAPVTQVPDQDVRAASSVEYTVVAEDNGGEQYRWEVTGGTITAGGTVTTEGAKSVVDFTADAHTITVDWTLSPSGITPETGTVSVQKISGDNCPSQVQNLSVNVWSLPTANISDANVEICSGDATAGSITVNLTGAPDDGTADGFSVSYEYDAPDIEDGTGPVDGQTGTVTTNTGSLTIPLPTNLINTVSTADRTFTVNLTAMTDDFDDQNGALTDDTYVITVHPSLETGDIVGASLNRR